MTRNELELHPKRPTRRLSIWWKQDE